VITVQLGKFSHKLLSLHVLRRDDLSREEGENLDDETRHRQSFVRGEFEYSATARLGDRAGVKGPIADSSRFPAGMSRTVRISHSELFPRFAFTANSDAGLRGIRAPFVAGSKAGNFS